MYTTNHRLSSTPSQVLGRSYASDPFKVIKEGSQSYGRVYSFRTGRGLKGQTTSSYAPAGSSITAKLASRKEYLEGIDRSFSGERAPLFYSQGRTNTFVRVRTTNIGMLESYRRRSLSEPWWVDGRRPFFEMPAVPGDFRDNEPVPSFIRSLGSNPVPPSRASLQNYGARMHHALNPLKASVGLGETIAEILSGNLPKIGSSFYKLLINDLPGKLRRAPKAASQDFLNSQFGIGPILDDLYKMLIEGILLHDALFGTSFRRGAQSPLEYSERSTTKSAAYGVAWWRPDGTVAFYQGSQSLGTDLSGFMTYDMRFRARFTLARDTSANGSYDKALALVRQYGLWTPSLLWDLTPWSWVFDWFLSLSRGITTAYDYGKDGGLHSDYACVTSRTQVAATANASDVGFGSSSYSGYRNSFLSHRTDTLIRIPVNPFGNFVELSNLSTWQKSILLALGLAKTTR